MTDKYSAGIEKASNSKWKVETIVNNHFVTLGTFELKGEVVDKAMDEHQAIKDFEPLDLAENIAGRMFPNANPLIVKKIWDE